MKETNLNETIKEIPKEQRPYEKCLREGTAALSDNELLAIILRSGTQGKNAISLANSLLNKMNESSYPGLLGILHCPIQELMEIHGIGMVKAVQLKCIGELSKRIATAAAKCQLSFQNPVSIAEYYMERLRHEEQEHMITMMLDSKNHLVGEQMITKGTVNNTLITPREVLLEALKYHAVSVILVHNHPSGDPSPSAEDHKATERMVQAGLLVGIPLLDHIIIGDHRYFSFREEGLLENFHS